MHPADGSFVTHDGATIRYRAWYPDAPSGRSLLFFHRGHEHGGRWQETIGTFLQEGYACFAWDQRGHGLSAGPRGGAPTLATVIHDADCFARHLTVERGVVLSETAVVAHSVGAVIAAAWVHDYAPPLRALVLATPAFRVKLYVPLALQFLRIKQAVFGPGTVKSYVKSSMLTHDPAQQRAYNNDPLISKEIPTNVLIDLFDTSTRLLTDAGAITVATLVLAADADWVVRSAPQRRFVQGLSSDLKRFDVLRGFHHAVFHERGRAEAVDQVRSFVNAAFALPVRTGHLRDADKAGYTRREYDRLAAPARCPLWPLQRAFLRTVGTLSDGVRLGWASGFDSGVTLDYIYRNRPSGRTALGRLIDRIYLGAIGWRGIRTRRENLQQVLRQMIQRARADGRPVHILDTASGAGRYVLEAIAEYNDPAITAHLRDYRQENLDAARVCTERLGLRGVTTELADAFDRDSVAAVRPRPTIAVVSGLYELFPDNDPVRRSLSGIHEAMADGGTLVYTNQPWHPQVEMIARVLTNREGKPWVMRRRTQEEMDQLVRDAGFEKTSQTQDQWGIFTVSTARKTR